MADRNCYYYEFLFDDAMKSCRGSGKCMARDIKHDTNLNPIDYYDCDSDDYSECIYFLRREKINTR